VWSSVHNTLVAGVVVLCELNVGLRPRHSDKCHTHVCVCEQLAHGYYAAVSDRKPNPQPIQWRM